MIKMQQKEVDIRIQDIKLLIDVNHQIKLMILSLVIQLQKLKDLKY